MNKLLVLFFISHSLLNAKALQVNSPLKLLHTSKYEMPPGRQMKIPTSTKLILVTFQNTVPHEEEIQK
ncbi:MAG TPA: hypothetical protein EYO73_08830 [Sulfurimonas sp.]|nr:hypothetical protein [Sulfurimonas sp.]